MLYFAYGSNMKTERLVDRVGKVKIVGKSLIEGYGLDFNKLGDNRSGKANIHIKEDSLVEGVLFDLTEEQIEKLDRNEGVNKHYMRCAKDIKLDGKTVVAEVYFANENKLQNGLEPTCDYLQYLLDGAKEHDLGIEYKNFIESFSCKNLTQQKK